MSGAIQDRGTLLREPRQVVVALRLLVLAGLCLIGVSARPDNPFLFWFVTIVYGVTNLGYLWANSRSFDLQRIKWMIFLFDVLMVSLLIVLRGSEVQHFLTAYFTLVLMAAIIDGLGNALLNALLVSTLYAALTNWNISMERALSSESLGQFVFFFVVALFMGHVAEGARKEKKKYRAAEEKRQQTQQMLVHASSELRQSTADLKAARESLRSNDHLFTLGMLSAGIAHEMKNPIAAILASVREAPDMLQELTEAVAAGEDPAALIAELNEVMSDSDAACRQLQRIVMDLNDMVRGGHAQTCTVNAQESLSGAARMLRKALGPEVQVNIEHRAKHDVRADPGRLMQVLLNLAKNAIDAMREHGGGTLTLRSEDGPGEQVTFRVQDTGPGIPEDVRRRMFEPFFTTKGPGEGTGLGLHLVNEIVKSQHGTIDCQTAPGEGTAFTVRLPRAPAENTGRIPHDRQEQDAPDRGRRGDDSPGAQANLAA